MIKTLRYTFMAMLMLVCSTAFAGVITLNATDFAGSETATVLRMASLSPSTRVHLLQVPATCITDSSSVSTRATY